VIGAESSTPLTTTVPTSTCSIRSRFGSARTDACHFPFWSLIRDTSSAAGTPRKRKPGTRRRPFCASTARLRPM
jgi:hypothetical protein